MKCVAKRKQHMIKCVHTAFYSPQATGE
ncbi:hypothetical protein CABS03_15317 [Colletotrichum abscissum]